jgi:hypothetical protein
MPAVALPEWLGLWLSDHGIDAQGLDDMLLGADESWLVITTTQALVAGDANQTSDVYRIDLGTDGVDLVSRTPRGTAGNGASGYPAADASGELIAFHSDADDLTAGDSNGVSDIFLHDWALTQTTRLTEAERAAARPALDAAGVLLLYDQEDVTGRRQILGRLPSAAEPPMQLSLDEDPTGWPLDSHHAAISADGRFVAYLEQRSGTVNEPEPGWCRVHLFDRHTKVYHRQACPAPLVAAADAGRAAFSADARWLEWNLPGQGARLILPNPLLTSVDD